MGDMSSCTWSTQQFLRATSPQPLSLSCPLFSQDPFELFLQLTGCARPSFLLESGGGNRQLGQYSFIGCDPYQTFSAKGATFEIKYGDTSVKGVGDTFSELRKLQVSSYQRVPYLPPFQGGAVGFLSYDMVRQFEQLPDVAVDDLHVPDMFFMFVDVLAAIDHAAQVLHFIFSPDPKRWVSESRDELAREGKCRLLEWREKMTTSGTSMDVKRMFPNIAMPNIQSQQSREDYVQHVQHCQELIAAGDIYQANLSHRFRVDKLAGLSSEHFTQGTCWYQQIRRVNPSPFSALMMLEDCTIVSNSPERLVRLDSQRADIRPIAGTRPRGSTISEDRRLIEELLASPKERAEHVMLVDLARNDLGRVCRYGSISAEQLMTVERYSHVSHLVSNIAGTLTDGLKACDLLRASFPGGTITGVPKVHCMEIIEQLEPVRRGLYTGSLGYMSWTGDMDMNILIRTLLLTPGQGYLQVGAGIVADSNPSHEYDETVHKAKAFLQAFPLP